jgi:hypothetical protein
MDFGALLHYLKFSSKTHFYFIGGVIKGGSTTTSLINLIMDSIMEKCGMLKKKNYKKILVLWTQWNFCDANGFHNLFFPWNNL